MYTNVPFTHVHACMIFDVQVNVEACGSQTLGDYCWQTCKFLTDMIMCMFSSNFSFGTLRLYTDVMQGSTSVFVWMSVTTT